MKPADARLSDVRNDGERAASESNRLHPVLHSGKGCDPAKVDDDIAIRERNDGY